MTIENRGARGNVLTVVGWSRPSYPGKQFYCPPHVPGSQRTLGERFESVSRDQALRCSARCETCGELLATEVGDE